MGERKKDQLVNSMWEVLEIRSYPKTLSFVSSRHDRPWALDSLSRSCFFFFYGLWSPRAMQMEGHNGLKEGDWSVVMDYRGL